MAEKRINGRIVLKHDVESNWKLATGFTPMAGEIIIYDVDANYNYERIKIGDGVQNVNALPFYAGSWDDLANRPFYEDSILTVVMPEETHTWASTDETYFHNVFSPKKNKTYLVVWDGVEYERVAYELMPGSDTGITRIGNSGDPFTFTATGLDVSTVGTYTFSVYLKEANLKMLDEKFIPDTIARQETIDTLVGDTSVSEQIAAAQMVYVGPDMPTDPNIKVWINTSEEGTGVIPVLPRVSTITLAATSWTGSSSPYSQVVEIATVTTATKIDLQPTVTQLVSLQNDDIALMAENENGVVTIYSFGGKPSSDMTMQVLLTEVSYV